MGWASPFWKACAGLLGLTSLSTFDDDIQQQVLSTDVFTKGEGPVFELPPIIGGDGSNFTCNYTRMAGYEACSEAGNRTCWLRNPKTGDTFDIFTDYETKRPTGILREYIITVGDGTINADGRDFKEAKLLNGTYPGPWIQACWGDTVKVTVVNQMACNGTSIHWHGIRQNQTMHMDGVNGITQCAIAPTREFTYIWNATQYGSSWYHSHFSVQYADGVAGPLTLHGPSSAPYDVIGDLPLLITDWGNNSAFEAIYNDGLDTPSMLLNGAGNITRFIGGVNTTTIPDPYTIVFTRTTKYLLRVINTSFSSAIVFSIDDHTLTVVEADFVPLNPYSTTSVVIGIGQRFHFVVEADPSKDPNMTFDNYWIRATVIKLCENPGNLKDGSDVVGILRYNKGDNHFPTSSPQNGIYDHSCTDESWKNDQFKPVVPWKVGSAVNGNYGTEYGQERTINFSSTPEIYPLAQWSLRDPTESTWHPLRIEYGNPTFLHLGDKVSTLPPEWVIVPENYTENDWVYIVIQGGGHPIHLHGHDFAVIQQGYGQFPDAVFNPNLDNPPRRDVIVVPSDPSDPPHGQGYAVIAFKTDNPGAWLMHCHIAFHASGGLALQIMERQSEALRLWPNSSPQIKTAKALCDQWNAWIAEPVQTCDRHDAWFQDDSGI